MGRQLWKVLIWTPVDPDSTMQSIEDPSETRPPALPGALCPPEAVLFFFYSLAALASYLLEVGSHSLVI